MSTKKILREIRAYWFRCDRCQKINHMTDFPQPESTLKCCGCGGIYDDWEFQDSD